MYKYFHNQVVAIEANNLLFLGYQEKINQGSLSEIDTFLFRSPNIDQSIEVKKKI